MFCKALTLSAAIFAQSQHYTTDYEQSGGYNEHHDISGGRGECYLNHEDRGWIVGASHLTGADSFGEDMHITAGQAKYKYRFKKEGWVAPGIMTGYTETSYYKGGIIAPTLEAGVRQVSVEGSYVPKIDGKSDAVGAIMGWYTPITFKGKETEFKAPWHKQKEKEK